MRKTGLWSQYNINTYQEQWAIPEKILAKQVTGVGETWNFQGSIKNEVESPQKCSRKSHVE